MVECRPHLGIRRASAEGNPDILFGVHRGWAEAEAKRLAIHYCRYGSEQDREDIQSKALIHLWIRRTSYLPTRGAWRPWAATVMANYVQRLCEREHRAASRFVDAPDVEPSTEGEDERIIDELMVRDLERTLYDFAVRQVEQDVQVLRAMIGADARTAGVSKSTLGGCYYRIKQALKARGINESPTAFFANPSKRRRR